MASTDPFATPPKLAGVWRPLTPAEDTVAANLLAYTSAMLRGRVPRLDDLIAAGKANPELIAQGKAVDATLVEVATIGIVKRVMMNPEAARQKSVTTGPFTESITIDSAVSSGALYVDDSDLAVFLPRRGRTGARIGTARLRAGLGF